jgi:putative redox protein
MMTLMGIAARTHTINMKNAEIKITKIMAANPRRVGEVIIDFTLWGNNFSEREKKILENAARTCPVALSLNAEIKQTVSFYYLP